MLGHSAGCTHQPSNQKDGPPRRLTAVWNVPQGQHRSSYGAFLKAAEDHGRRYRNTADEVEPWLFENAPRFRTA